MNEGAAAEEEGVEASMPEEKNEKENKKQRKKDMRRDRFYSENILIRGIEITLAEYTTKESNNKMHSLKERKK